MHKTGRQAHGGHAAGRIERPAPSKPELYHHRRDVVDAAARVGLLDQPPHGALRVGDAGDQRDGNLVGQDVPHAVGGEDEAVVWWFWGRRGGVGGRLVFRCLFVDAAQAANKPTAAAAAARSPCCVSVSSCTSGVGMT
jgi:hypothetical protein